MTKNQAIAIRFDNGRAIPVEMAFDYADKERVWPSEVIWDDGSYSYAKGWQWSENGRFCLIGAGAYGNMEILSRDARKLPSVWQ